MKKKVERIKKWRGGGTAGPYTLEINPTNRCNLECRFCWQRIAEPDYSKELASEKILEIIDQAIEIGVKEVRIPGSGEPLIRKDTVLEMMEKIKDGSAHGLLITNGTLLDEEILEKMVECKWDNLTVSVDGPDAETHDYLRQKGGTFQKVKQSLNTLTRIKSKAGRHKPKLRLHTVLTNRNYDKLPEMVEFARRYKCEVLKLQPMTPFSEIGEQCMFDGDQEELNNYLRDAEKLADKYGLHTNIESIIESNITKRTDEMEEVIMEEASSGEDNFSSVPCFEPWYNMVILPTGKVAQCSMFGGNGGDQINDKTLEEVWFGDYFQEARRRILDKELFSYCENCCVPVNQENKRIRERLQNS